MQFVILAGGLGTRSKECKPKILTTFGDKPLLYNYFEQINNYALNRSHTSAIFSLGHGASEVINQIEVCKSKGLVKFPVRFVHESKPLGVLGALRESIEYLEDEVVVMMGDLYFDFDFEHFVQVAKARKAELVALIHPNGHIEDSDVAVIDHSSYLIQRFDLKHLRTKSPKSYLALAGIFYLSNYKEILANTFGENLGSFLESSLAYKKKNFGYLTAEFIKDIGTPTRRKIGRAHV